MYVVILAGGGGTRLHPLSRPERPKPFLPLLGRESLLQRTARRLLDGGELGLAPADITVVTDRRYAELVREQLPGHPVLAEPLGRNTAAAIALATLAVERPDDEVMAVLPADHVIEREAVFRVVLGAAASSLATGAFGVDDPLVTLGIQVDGPATEYGYLLPDVERGETVDGVRAYPLRAFEEKPNPARARDLVRMPGVAWNAGMFLWRRRAIHAALERYTGLIQTLRPMLASPVMLEQAYDRVKPISIDYAVMEGAAADGRVVMAGMDVGWSDLGSWSALLAAIGAEGSGGVVQPGESVEVDGDDLVVRRFEGRLAVLAPNERGRMTARQPLALLRGARSSRALIAALLQRCDEAGSPS